MSEKIDTKFAPAARSAKEVIESQRKLLSSYYGTCEQFFDAVSEIILILNQDRQIVYFNSAVPALLGVKNPEFLYGLRPGEALGCIHDCETPGGCGTTEFCSQCGAVRAILASLSNKMDLQECRIAKRDIIESLDLLVRTTPLEIEGQMFSIMAITDISHEKRRRALERTFFHDVMNTAASMNLFAKMLKSNPGAKQTAAYLDNLLVGSNQLLDQLRSQKELLAAEHNDLPTEPRKIDGYLLLKDVVEIFSNRHKEHCITLKPAQQSISLKTDYGLLCRVIGNMLQNAIEATEPGEPITVSCATVDSKAEFKVHNKSFIPKESQLQLFQRSFSTKGPGRGLGTYSMKLLSEKYLGGSIDFSSSPRHGTTFIARYPL